MTKVIKSKEDLKRLQRHRQAKKGLTIVGGTGIFVGGVYLYHCGRKRGFSEGVSVGYVTAGQEMIEAWRTHSEELRKSREVIR